MKITNKQFKERVLFTSALLGMIITLLLVFSLTTTAQTTEKGTFFKPYKEVGDSCKHIPKHTAYLNKNDYTYLYVNGLMETKSIYLIQYKLIKRDKCLLCDKWVLFDKPRKTYIFKD